MRKIEIPEWVFFWLGAIPDHEIAPILGCTRETVYRRRRELGIVTVGSHYLGEKYLNKRRQRERTDALVRDLLPKLQSIGKVAKVMGVSKQRVHQIALRAGCHKIWAAS